MLPIEINLRSILTLLLALVVVAAGVICLTGKTGCGSGQLRVRGDFSSITSALKMYQINNGQLPSTSIGLEALLEKPAGLPATAKWTRLMDDIPLDPWGMPYRYIRDDSADNGFRLFSTGPDLASSTKGNDPDDVASWDKDRAFPAALQSSNKAVVFLLVSGVFLAGGLAGIFLKSRPERLFVFAS